jgi:hypothetical protein
MRFKNLLEETTLSGKLVWRAGRDEPGWPHDSTMHAGLRRRCSVMARATVFSCVCLSATLCLRADAAPDQQPFNFAEVFELLKANLAGVTEEQLSEAAVRGLLEQLAGKVSVVGETPTPVRGAGSNAPVSAAVFDRHFGYLRVNRFSAGTDKEFQGAYERLAAANTLKGLVIDLRFAGGKDYAAAVAVADRFFADEQALVDWGEGWKKSTGKTNAISLPVALLVNRKTRGAAEALAGMLRHREIGLLIGTNTAGEASMAREFSLKTGHRLRLAVAPVKVANGRELPFSGIKADIEVEVSPEDELGWYEDAYKSLPKPARLASAITNETSLSATNRATRRRLNEAELVRMNKEGQSLDREPPFTNDPSRTVESPPVVNDPSLVRALDLLKGLAVVQQFRSI